MTRADDYGIKVFPSLAMNERYGVDPKRAIKSAGSDLDVSDRKAGVDGLQEFPDSPLSSSDARQ